MSWAVEVNTADDPKYYGTILRFSSLEEAVAYAENLMGRWPLVARWRVQESSQPATHRWDYAGSEAVKIGDG